MHQCTQGTWVYLEHMSAVIVGRKDMIKMVADFGTSDLPEAVANGRLMAASKEMFEALVKAKDFISRCGDSGMDCEGIVGLIEGAMVKAVEGNGQVIKRDQA